MKGLKEYIVSLGDREFIPTGLKTAVFVGSLLFLINHGPALWRREMTRERWISTIVTYTMPYLVNVYGQYSYRRKLATATAPLK
ncbi:nitrate/nitrite transporter NrtS (plasmid) [Kovacikia minuta CCNUW1]|uniref:nitrate/nitrite transporter NrtS n=1 Tax=Kovacikia minuta TaxID=2931930 RepID=UPI001CCBABAE|nr:nitrate/nitrite transporter NrtS [Kovacikia minuta]UBF30314.1 nitrate/nitrite transporter NrtS [Kovacikia minuta CCNUW1]